MGYGRWGGAAGAVKGETLESCKVGLMSRAVGDLAEVDGDCGWEYWYVHGRAETYSRADMDRPSPLRRKAVHPRSPDLGFSDP